MSYAAKNIWINGTKRCCGTRPVATNIICCRYHPNNLRRIHMAKVAANIIHPRYPPKNLRWNYAATKAAVTNIIHLRYLPKIRQQIRTFACWATTNTIRHHNHPNSWQIHAMVGMAAEKAKIIHHQDLQNPPHRAVVVVSLAAVTTTWMLLWLPIHHNVGITPSCHDAINDGQCFVISCWFPTWIPFSIDMSSAVGEMNTAAPFRVDLGINSINSNCFKVWNWSLYLRQDGICCQKQEKY